MLLAICAWLVLSIVEKIDSSSTGAPDSACQTLLPGHGLPFQTTPPPYEILVTGNMLDGNVTVTLQSIDGLTAFKGFLLQARKEDQSNIGSGTFEFPAGAGIQQACLTAGSLTYVVQYDVDELYCKSALIAGRCGKRENEYLIYTWDAWNWKGSSVTHTSSDLKYSVNVTWMTPSSPLTNVEFVVTVVQAYSTFWLLSSENGQDNRTTVRTTLATATDGPAAEIDTSSCGTTKGCFVSSCVSGVCDYTVTWADAENGNAVAFELSGKVTETNPYLALGLSMDQDMGSDSVTECIYSSSSGAVQLQMSWNEGDSNQAIQDSQASLVNGSTSGSLSSGRLVCRFTRYRNPPANTTTGNIFYPGTDAYYLLIATGPTYGGVISKHTSSPNISPNQLNLTDFHYENLPDATVTDGPVIDVDTSSCGTTKGCFLNNCVNGTCDYVLTWADALGGAAVAFELSGKVTESTPYLSVGLSMDQSMGSDSVTDCLYDSFIGGVTVQMSWNEGKSNPASSASQVSLVPGSMSGSRSNGRLVCRFTRYRSPSPTSARRKRQAGTIYYPGTQAYYLMIATGPAPNGIKGKHTTMPIVSANQIVLTDFTYVSNAVRGLSPMIKAHGILMIFAWMVFASFGMLMPRYFKPVWPGKLLFGKAIWFQLHQPCMIITLLLTAAAFIIIFVEAEGYVVLESPAVAHPPLDIIVMILVIINPFMSIFRCAPNDKNRWIFNVCHFLVGLIAHLCAAVALFLAMYIQKLNLPEWCLWVMVGYICWHAAIEVLLAIHMHYILQRSKQNALEKDLQMTELQTSVDDNIKTKKAETTDDSNSIIKTVLGVCHLVGVLGCAIALSVQIGIS